MACSRPGLVCILSQRECATRAGCHRPSSFRMTLKESKALKIASRSGLSGPKFGAVRRDSCRQQALMDYPGDYAR